MSKSLKIEIVKNILNGKINSVNDFISIHLNGQPFSRSIEYIIVDGILIADPDDARYKSELFNNVIVSLQQKEIIRLKENNSINEIPKIIAKKKDY